MREQMCNNLCTTRQLGVPWEHDFDYFKAHVKIHEKIAKIPGKILVHGKFIQFDRKV